MLGTLIAASLLAPQVHTVDDDPGADFTEVQAAIDAAQDGDTILIRSGVYQSIQIDGRSLTIVADVDAVVRMQGISISNVAAEDALYLRGIETGPFGPGAFQVVPGLSIQGCDGPVLIENCVIGAPGQPTPLNPPGIAIRVALNAQVLLVDTTANGTTSNGFGGTNGAPAVLVDSSTLSIFGGEYEGGSGLDQNESFLTGFPGGSGAAAVQAENSDLFLAGATLIGGDGGRGSTSTAGSGFLFPCGDGGPGGDAVLANGSSVTLRGGTPIPGTGGAPGGPPPEGPACAFGADGAPIAGTSQTITTLSGIPRTFAVSPNPVREGQVATQFFTGEPGDLVLWALSVGPSTLPLTSFGGPVLVSASPFVVNAGSVPASGELSLPVAVGFLPPGQPSLELVEQALMLPLQGAPVVTQPRRVVLFDSSF
ncbi:MAG: hypothetical protein AAFZ65_00985 [Planctomycetota bacterium]